MSSNNIKRARVDFIIRHREDGFFCTESLFLNGAFGPIKITNMSRFAKQTHLFKLASAWLPDAECIKLYVYIRSLCRMANCEEGVGGETLSHDAVCNIFKFNPR